VDIQRSELTGAAPSDAEISRWAQLVLERQDCPSSVSVRIVDEVEITELNSQYRNRNQATNVLSFPCDLTDESGVRLLGDIIACEPVITREAREQGKTSHDHWAHIIVHGLLHLIGYDHIEDQQAEQMEDLEVKLLGALEIANPYAESA
jgi:probable rRNA maturation factor